MRLDSIRKTCETAAPNPRRDKKNCFVREYRTSRKRGRIICIAYFLIEKDNLIMRVLIKILAGENSTFLSLLFSRNFTIFGLQIYFACIVMRNVNLKEIKIG